MPGDRCSLRLTRRYAEPPSEVWVALLDVDRWLAPPRGVTNRRAVAERRLELDWQPDGEPPSEVVVELRTDGDATLLVLEHTQIEATIGMRYLSDWARALERFEAHG